MKSMKKVLAVILSVITLITAVPVSAVSIFAADDSMYGNVTSITDNLTVTDSNSASVKVNHDSNITLSWAKADQKIGRSQDGWWAGIKMTAPKGLSADKAKFGSLAYGAQSWSDGKSFWDKQDSDKNDNSEDMERYITLWSFVNQEKIIKAKDKDNGKITTQWHFDWDGDSSYEQSVAVELDVEKIILKKGETQVYPFEKYGKVEPITAANIADINDSNSANITVSYKDMFALEWSDVDNTTNMPRTKAGWWAGVKMTAPQEADLNNAKYNSKAYGASDWSQDKSFNQFKDGENYITLWAFVNEESLNKALLADENISTMWRFDWNNDGVPDQQVTTEINPSKVVLNKNSVKVYPSNTSAEVLPITQANKMNVNGSKENIVSVSNNDTITLEWSQANQTIGRDYDGWWAGINIIAPNGFSIDKAQYKALYNGSDSWKKKFFKDCKDSDNNITMWAFVDENFKNQDAIQNEYQFDWDGDGVYEQYITFSLNTANIELNYTNFYAMDKAAPTVSVQENGNGYKNGDINVEFAVEDNGTESNGETYISGISKVYYSTTELEKLTIEDLEALNEKTEVKSETKDFSFQVSGDFNGKYYIYAVDNAGNVGMNSIKVQLDNTAPEFTETSVDTETLKNTWTNGQIEITGKIVEELSGVASYEYDTKATDVTLTYDDKTSEYKLTIEKQTFKGDITLTFKDNAGNSNSITFNVKMDDVKCEIISIEYPQEWVNKDFVIEGIVFDNVSGVKSVSAKLDDDTKVQPQSKYNRENGSYTVTVSAQDIDGNCIVTFEDNAGNTNTKTVSVRIDTKKPVVDTAEASLSDWTNEKVTIKGNVSDTGDVKSDVKYVGYVKGDSIEDLTSENFLEKLAAAKFNTESGEYEFTLNKQNYDGNYAVYCIDNAGNISEVKTVAVKMDIHAPENMNVKYPESINKGKLEVFIDGLLKFITFGYYQPTVDITLSAEDKMVDGVGSGIKEFDCKVIDTETSNVIGKGTLTAENGEAVISIAEEGNYIVEFTVRDNAGNEVSYRSISNDTETNVQGAIIDNTAPVITIDYSSVDDPSKDNTPNTVNGVEYYKTKQIAKITVTEKNFDPNKVTAKITQTDVNGEPKGNSITDINGNEISDTAEYFKKEENWTSGDGYTHTIEIKLNGDANYDIILNCEDLAGNGASINNDKVTVDTTAPEIKVDYSESIFTRILKAISFGFYKGETTVTVTTTDNTTPIDMIEYKTVAQEGASEVNTTSVSGKAMRVSDNPKDELKSDEKDKGIAWVKFSIPANFRGFVSASAINLSKLTAIVTDEGGNEKTTNGVVVDNIAPQLASITARTPDIALNPKDCDDVIELPNESSIELSKYSAYELFYDDEVTVKISVNEANFDQQQDAENNEIIAPDKELGEESCGNTSVTVNGNEQKVTWHREGNSDIYYTEITLKGDGRYKIVVNCTDMSGNSMETYTSQDIIIDEYAPLITGFSFDTEGSYYHKDSASADKSKNQLGSTEKNKNNYDYYFEDDFTVTVKASDAVAPKNNEGENSTDSASGIKDIILIARDVEKNWVKVIDNDDLIADSKFENQKSFTIKGPFKGNLYAVAIDRLGHYPTGESNIGWKTVTNNIFYEYTLTDKDILPKGAELEVGAKFIAPNDSIIEDNKKHTQESDITVSINAKATEQERKKDSKVDNSWLSSKTTGVPRDKKVDFAKDQKIDLFKKNISVTLSVEDKYSGIREVEWYVKGRDDQDSKNNKNGKLVIDNNGKASKKNDTDWTFKKNIDDNLVLRASKNINITNNSNDIIILVILTDRAGNKSYDYKVIGIDKTKPEISVEYSDSNQKTGAYENYYNHKRTATISIKERNFDAKYISTILKNIDTSYDYIPDIKNITNTDAWSRKGTSDNKTYSYKIRYVDDGKFKFNIEMTDVAGNKASRAEKAFTIDLTAPKISIALDKNDIVKNNKYFNETRTAVITVTEHNFNKTQFENLIKATLNGSNITIPQETKFTRSSDNPDEWATKVTFSEDGDYVNAFKYTDKAGNAYTASKKDYEGTAAIEFTIDKTAPEVSIDVNDKYAYITGPVVKVTEKDNNCSDITSTMTGVVWNNDSGVMQNVNVVSSEQHLNEDHHNADFVVTYEKITTDGFYTVNAKCVDMAGNESVTSIKTFTKNEYGAVYVPSYDLSNLSYANKNNLSGEKLYFDEYSPNPIEADENQYYININGKMRDGYISRENIDSNNGWYHYRYILNNDKITAEGLYDIFVRTESSLADGNITNNDPSYTGEHRFEKSFVIDNTNPYVRISGLEQHIYRNATSHDVTLTVSDNNLYKIKVTINEDIYIWVSDADKYKLLNNEKGATVKSFVFAENDKSIAIAEFTLALGASDIKIEISDLAGNYCCNESDYNKDDLFLDASQRLNSISESNTAGEIGILLSSVTVTDNWFEALPQMIKDNQPMAIAIFVGIAVILFIIIFVPIIVKRRKKLDEYDSSEIE